MPIRPIAADELRAMASRQQQQIESQHQLLTQKEQRLRFLKAQETRGSAVNLDNEKLRRLKERVEAQESKLRRLRALKGQIDVQKTYNVALSNDLDAIRACFSEKEKELSIAVAKVEALTRQLEELRRGRRGFGLTPQDATNQQQQQQPHSSVTRELEKLRRELMYRNQLSLQQDARLHLQREALQQRQAELRSVDQRIIELQERLQKRKSANILQQTNLNVNNNNNTSVKGNSMHVRSASTHVYPVQKNTKCNIVAVEPYNHTPNNSSVAPVNPKHSIIDDLALLKLSQDKNSAIHGLIDTDKNELNRHLLIKNQQQKDDKYQLMKQQQTQDESDDSRRNNLIGQQIQSGRKSNSTNDENNYNKNNNNDNDTSSMLQSHHVISSIISSNAAAAAAAAAVAKQQNEMESNNEKENKKSSLVENNNESFNELSGLETLKKIHSIHHIPSGNLVVPPRKPISKVAPNVNTQLTMNDNEKNKPALPPKPLKSNKLMLNDESNNSQQMSNLPIKAKPLTIKKQPLSEQPRLRNTSAPLLKPIQMMGNRKVEPNSTSSSHQQQFSDVTNNDINNERKSIEEDLNGNTNNINNINNNDNFIISKLINSTVHNLDFTTATNTSTNAITAPPPTADEPDRSATHHESTTIHQENERPFGINNNNNIVRRTRNLIGDSTKTKLARRVSFDPLALLLDASLEGELELVKKTAMQVPNPSASNDEGITALHNAICAGHLEIVKFLVQFGCDVNAQDSDGWTPLHCAASCNNLAMVKFLVDSGACLFASTLSDHETPAEKCEEDEEGFDGCSEYLYSIQEKLGILNNGEVFAVFSYNAQQPDELEFSVNDKLIILRKGDEAEREWWWAKNDTNREGYVPRNLLGLYPRIIPSSNHIVGE